MAPDEMKYPLVNEAKALVGVLSAPGTLSGAAPAAVAAAVTGELVKNALVALDGAWFETRGRAAGGWQGRSRRRALRARVGFDADTMTLMVADSGVGLTRADLINTLSHTSRGADVRGFAAALAARSGAGLLEAGAGLWTAFAAADRVDVHTKHTDDDCYSWTVDTKDDAASFTITTAGPEAPPPPLLGMIGGCGTAVCLKLRPGPVADALLDPAALRAAVLTHAEASQYSVKLWEDGDDAEAELKAAEAAAAAGDGAGDDDADMDVDADAADEFDHDDAMGLADGSEAALRTVTPMIERAKYIPVRLSYDERKYLRLVEGVLRASRYTDRVDVLFDNPVRRLQERIKAINGVLGGILVACNYRVGGEALDSGEFEEHAQFFQTVFEIARRYKILNPERMRSEYGKLLYFLQDTMDEEVMEEVGVCVVKPIKTVYKLLEAHGGLALLNDRHADAASREILAEHGVPRHEIQRRIKTKEKALAHLKRKYSSHALSEDDISTCMYSCSDNDSFLNTNRLPVDKALAWLYEHFSPAKVEDGYSLAISAEGADQARLTHNHERQFHYVAQSLTLWREILDDFYRLWFFAEADLLSGTPYELKNTGQGMQRVQQSPRTYKAMHDTLKKAQDKCAKWIGSSMIHLGDHNVPNALTFIDKYTQVARIMQPLCTCIEVAGKLADEDKSIRAMLDESFGGYAKLRKDVLLDFFRSGFDGSGADNFYDAGSCIDGRLTSAWNWCSHLPERDFFVVFRLAGFRSFDGF